MCIRDNDFIQHKHVIHSHHMQNKATAAKGSKGMRWHPLMIKWCLYLKSLSTAAYETLRDVIRLPSTRTLRDYTHWMTAEPGSFIAPTTDYYINTICCNMFTCWLLAAVSSTKIRNVTGNKYKFANFVQETATNHHKCGQLLNKILTWYSRWCL